MHGTAHCASTSPWPSPWPVLWQVRLYWTADFFFYAKDLLRQTEDFHLKDTKMYLVPFFLIPTYEPWTDQGSNINLVCFSCSLKSMQLGTRALQIVLRTTGDGHSGTKPLEQRCLRCQTVCVVTYISKGIWLKMLWTTARIVSKPTFVVIIKNVCVHSVCVHVCGLPFIGLHAY